jgi:hypothetical protein
MPEKFRDFFNRYHEFGRFGLMVEREQQKILEEGLITSYPFSNVLVMLSQKYGHIIKHMQSELVQKGEKTAGISIFVKRELANQKFVDDLTKDLKVYGYFIAFKDDSTDEIGFFIEPKFPFIIDQKYLKNKRCFHITQKKYLPKIQKIGLVPKNSQTHFNFDGSRIYMMFGEDERVINNFKITLAKNKEIEIEKLVLLEIFNFDRLKLYFDLNFGIVAGNIPAFTLDNIYSDNVKVIG